MRPPHWFIASLCSLLCALLLVTESQATIADPLTTINIDTPIHFLAPDGSPMVAPSGIYSVEAAEEWLRLVPGERHDAVLIEAKKSTHELDLTDALALSVTGTEDDGQDLHHVILLLPNGESLESTGTYSGIRPRGFFEKAMNNVKKKAKKAHKKAKSTTKKAVSQAKGTTQKATKQAQRQTQKAVSQAKKGAKKVQKQVRKGTQQAVSSAKQNYQNSRKAALQAKRQVEKASRRVGSKIKGGMQKARQTVTGGKWTLWSQTAGAAARTEALGWLSQMFIDRNNCQVMATVAIGKPGVLKSRYSFKGGISKALKAVGASKAIAEGWDKAFKESWELWAKNVMIPGLPFYPAFAAFPGPQVPPMPNVPFPLSALLSAGAKAMTPPALAKKVQSRMGAAAKTQEAKIAINAFATDFGGRFTQCMAGCQLMNVIGSGPVPSFAPPFMPVGPVVGGSCTGGNIPTAAGFFQPRK